MRALLRAWAPRALALLVLLGATSASGPQVGEHAAKAAILLKILGYVKWPERAFDTPTSPIQVAVVGADPFGKTLEETFKGRRIGSRTVTIERFKSVSDIGPCHVLFTPEAEAPRLDRILERTTGRPVLIVGEAKGFAEGGGCVNFFVRDKKIGFEINTDATKRAELELSSQLLSFAKIVRDAKEEKR